MWRVWHTLYIHCVANVGLVLQRIHPLIGIAEICNRYTMPTRDLSWIHEEIINKPEGVAQGFTECIHDKLRKYAWYDWLLPPWQPLWCNNVAMWCQCCSHSRSVCSCSFYVEFKDSDDLSCLPISRKVSVEAHSRQQQKSERDEDLV